MKTKIVKHYKGDKYWFYVITEYKKRECVVSHLFKNYRANISDDFKRVELIDKIEISGIHENHPKTLNHLTINKWDVKDMEREVLGTW